MENLGTLQSEWNSFKAELSMDKETQKYSIVIFNNDNRNANAIRPQLKLVPHELNELRNFALEIQYFLEEDKAKHTQK